MNVRLNKESINIAIEKLNNLKEEITDVALSQVVDKLLREGEKVAIVHANSAARSGLEPSRVINKKLKSGLGGYIALVGENAVYDEFGTGEEGAATPHPLKGNFGLNDYNSGPYVSKQIDAHGKHYWIYKPMTGRRYFDVDDVPGKTYGIPSGRMIYHADMHIKQIKDNVVKEELNATLKKFK